MNRYSCILLLIILFFFKGYSQNNKIDSLHSVLALEKEDSNLVNTLNALGDGLFKAAMYDSSISYSNRAKTIALKIGFERGLASSYCNLASASSFKGNNPKAIEYANKAIEISKKYNILKLMAHAYNILGFTYSGVENYPKALDAFSAGISVCRKSGDKKNLCACLANIGLVYYSEHNLAKALEYDTLALTSARDINFTQAIYSLQSNIGEMYNAIGNYNKAKEYYNRSFATAQKLGDNVAMSDYYSNIGEIYFKEGNYRQALDNKNKSLAIIRNTEKTNDIANAYNDVGKMYYSLKNYGVAKLYLDSALTIAEHIGELEITKDTYQSLYLLDSIKGDAKTGLEDYKKYIFYRDSMANEASVKKIAQAEMNYNFARKMDSAQAEQDKLNVIAETEKGRQRIIEYSLAGGLTLAFVSSGIFFFQRRRISKERQKLKESNEVKDKLFSIISHDLRSPLNLLNGMLALFKRGKITNENSEALSQNLESSMQNTMSLLDNLLSWSHTQMKGFNMEPAKLKLDKIIQDKINVYTDAAMQKGVQITSVLQSGVELNADENVINLVLRNLISNAIKFSNAGGKIIISTFNGNGHSGFSVKDEGIGIPKENIGNLFKLGDTKKIQEGTANEPGTGLGLVLCDELVSRSGGKLKVESEEGKGTSIYVLFQNKVNSMAD